MFIRQAWYVAAWGDEVGDQPLARRICDEPIVLYRGAKGRVYALADYCCHRGSPLNAGSVIDEALQCGYHGMMFGGDGACIAIPGQTHIPQRARVRSYPVVEKDAIVWIWMGEPSFADESKIVDHPYHLDSEQWPHKHALLPIRCSATLLIDNLMDLTHLGYVHTKTIGGGNPREQVDALVDTRPREDGLSFTRWVLDSATPPTHAIAVPTIGDKVDRWQEFDFSAPACIRQWSGSMPVSCGAYSNGRTNDYFSVQIFHGITPETATTTLYFWSVAIGYRQDDPQTLIDTTNEVARTFNEDKATLELQQQRYSEIGEGPLVNIVSDGTRMQMRRILERMLEAERAAPMIANEPALA